MKMQRFATFYQILHCLLCKKGSSENEMQPFRKIINFDLSIHITDHSGLIVSDFVEKSLVNKGLIRILAYPKSGGGSRISGKGVHRFKGMGFALLI